MIGKDTLYKAGQSGNPKGRPKGSDDKRLRIRHMLEERGEEVVDKVVEMALSGDVSAMKIVMERISPKPRAEKVTLGVNIKDKSRDEFVNILFDLIDSGKITIDDATKLAKIKFDQASTDHKVSLLERLAAIEEHDRDEDLKASGSE